MADLEFLNQDRFFLNLDNGFVEWMYYNPDSVSGGQFVINIFGIDDITDALAGTMDVEDAFDYIGGSCDQYLADKGTAFFGEAWQRMSAGEPFAIGCSHTTLANLQLAFQARELIDRYCQREFKMNGEYDNLRKIAIGYTTITDAEHHVQGYAKVIDKAAVAGERMRTAFVRTKDQTQNLMDDGQASPHEYAEDQIRYAAEDIVHDVGHEVKRGTKNAIDNYIRSQMSSNKLIPDASSLLTVTSSEVSVK